MPVSVSPLMMAQLMGAAPRYCGRREACTLIVPMGGIFQTTSGSIRKATTTCRSALSNFSSSRNSGFLSFSGCNTFRLFSIAYFFTALSFSFMPRPAGLSGAVTTPTILHCAFTNASREATAKSGVPMKIILRFLYWSFINN